MKSDEAYFRGSGGQRFSATLHGDAYQKVYGLDVKMEAVASVEDTIHDFAKKYNIPKIYSDYAEMLKDPDIDVVDICTPPHLHVPMIKQALAAGKHVICEKPLSGYFGGKGADNDHVGESDKRVMYEKVMEELNDLKKVVESSDKLFMYAENFVYAPSIQKTLEFLRAKRARFCT